MTTTPVEYVKINNPQGRKHPHYDDRLDLWNFLLASWRGGLGMEYRIGLDIEKARNLKFHGYYAGLFRFKREALEDYVNRVAMSPYSPLARQIVEEYVRYVTKDQPERTGSESFKELIENTDRTGRNIDTFVRDALSLALVMGEICILVDMPQSDVPIASKADAESRGLRPYAVVVLPQAIIDWSIGDDGRYDWLIIETVSLDNSVEYQSPMKVTRRTYYDKQYWQVYEQKTATDGSAGNSDGQNRKQEWTLVASGEHNCGETPVIRIVVNDVDRNALTPESWFFDLADMNRAIYNLDSLDLANLYYQTFGILILPPADDSATVVLSRAHALTENPETKGISRFIQTTGAEGESFDRKINDIKIRMFQTAGLQYNTEKNVAESGISKAWNFQRVNQFLAGVAKYAELIEARVSELAAKWQGGSDGYTAQYPRTYNVKELAELIEAVLGIKNIGFASETGRKEAIKRLYHEVLDDTTREIMATIEKEVDASEEPDPLEATGFDLNRGGDNDNAESADGPR